MLQFPDMSSLLGGNSFSDSNGSSVGGVSLGDIAEQSQAELEGFEALGGTEINVTRSVSEADIVMQKGVFPVWFHNPFFDPKISHEKLSQIDQNPADFAAEYDTTEKITDQYNEWII